MNNVNLIGRMVGEPRISETRTGKRVAHFSIAINGQRNNVTFVPVTAWDTACTTAQKYLHKGYQVGISGRLATSNNNQLEVIVNAISLIESQKSAEEINELLNAGTTKTTDEDLLDELGDFPL